MGIVNDDPDQTPMAIHTRNYDARLVILHFPKMRNAG
jgi:hypothetical protein